MAEVQKIETIDILNTENGKRILTQFNETEIGEKSGITEKEIETVSDVCKVTPIDAYMSTSLNSKITSFDKLATRILNFLGYPAVSVPDLHRDQIYEAIAVACELYTKYAGYERQNLVFHSNMYEPSKGVRIDQLCTIASLEAWHDKGANYSAINKSHADKLLRSNKDVYVTRVYIPKKDYYISEKDFEMLNTHCKEGDKEVICKLRDISIRFPDGIEELSVISSFLYEYLVTRRGYNKDQFKKSKNKVVTEGGEELTIYMEDEQLGQIRDDLYFENMYDYDIMDYRKVVGVYGYNEGSSTTMSSLFSFEAALASQTFFTYQYTMRGFDLVSWHGLAEWRKTRERLLATKRDWQFNEYTQYFTLSPQPASQPGTEFYGVVQCYVERPLRDIIKSPWVFKYAMACVKEILGRIRSKWGDSVALPGGGSLTGNALAQEGVQEKKDLEQLLMTTHGFGEAPPPLFFIG